MSTIKINGININYEQIGNGKDLVCLHGWGQNLEMMKMVSDHFKDSFRVISIDFPGFGQSDDPLSGWSLEDYEESLNAFFEALNINNPILLGHSFGCRVAILHASKHPVHKMVLTGAAGIRAKRSFAWYVRTYTFKTCKVLVKLPFLNRYEEKMKKVFGSSDYKQSSGVMRETFVKVVNSDITSLLEKMDMPVLLVWGENDEATPLWMGKMMEQKMQNAGLAIFEQDDHYAYWHQWERFNRCLDIFLESDKEN